MLVLDVDGVLTDGRLYYGAEGEVLKAFHVRDGLGVKLLLAEGIDVAVISGRTAPALSARLADMHVAHAFVGRDDKHAAFEELVRTLCVPEAQIAYVGDDVLDLPVLRRVGLPIAVADAHPLVRAEAVWITEAAGGRGAAREVADGLLEVRGRLRDACEDLLNRLAPGETS